MTQKEQPEIYQITSTGHRPNIRTTVVPEYTPMTIVYTHLRVEDSDETTKPTDTILWQLGPQEGSLLRKLFGTGRRYVFDAQIVSGTKRKDYQVSTQTYATIGIRRRELAVEGRHKRKSRTAL